jgi:hypothetical protein
MPLGRPSCRRESKIEVGLQEVGWGGEGGIKSIDVAVGELWGSIKCMELPV